MDSPNDFKGTVGSIGAQPRELVDRILEECMEDPWKTLYNALPEEEQLEWHNKSHGFAEDFGLNILLQALDQANIKPKRIVIPVHLESMNCFASYTSSNVLQRVCQKVEELHTSPFVYESIYDQPLGQPNEILITVRNFPVLRRLGLRRAEMNTHALITPRDDPGSFPRLTRLTIQGFGIDHIKRSFHSFLDYYSDTLKSSLTRIEFFDCWGGPWNHTLQILAGKLTLNSLLIDTKEADWETICLNYRMDWNVNKRLLANAATESEICPPDFKHLIEAGWVFFGEETNIGQEKRL
ncbi:hypothetical protein EJ04DRAFT_551180 [Polyplosphaeria fusca]|uniref:Uncharacterized protein n=1 Tax=Polyplosphaeria fusca TaxID=682080 RepID=A0A9P4V3F8_9PLEO|nr:hypothetical protein EJ04DRAFT_551180 [Polyplosphaeria fusca]